jgi:hypothetical protein
MDLERLEFFGCLGIVNLNGEAVDAKPVGKPITVSVDHHEDVGDTLLEGILRRTLPVVVGAGDANAYVRGDINSYSSSEKRFYIPVQFYEKK